MGASSETDPIEITEECFAGSAIVHLEGYLVFNQNLMLKALESAKKGGAVVSLDLASFTIVEQSKAFLDRIIREYVDILIANEDEARIFTGFTDEKDAISSLSQKAEIAVLKVGKRGTYIAEKGNIIKVKAHGSEDIIDRNGAGDLWGYGFLYGIINGFSFEKCGEVASACGYEVCRVIGASIPEEGWNRIRAVAGK